MLRLIKRCAEYTAGYKDYCQEMYDNNVVFFRPTDPDTIDDGWFMRTKPLYDKKEQGLLEGQPISCRYWAMEDGLFIGEFQFRPELSDNVMSGIGSIGYSVRVSQWGKGYGTEILSQGLEIAKGHGMDKVLLTINDASHPSMYVKSLEADFGML